jgi:hypothetical protein
MFITANKFYPQPVESSSHLHVVFLQHPFQYYIPIYTCVPSGFFPSDFPSNILYRAPPTYERPTYEHSHLRTGGRRALSRTCEQLFTLRTWVSPFLLDGKSGFEYRTNDLRTEIWNATRFVSWGSPLYSFLYLPCVQHVLLIASSFI